MKLAICPSLMLSRTETKLWSVHKNVFGGGGGGVGGLMSNYHVLSKKLGGPVFANTSNTCE